MDSSCNMNTENRNHKFLLEKPEGKMSSGEFGVNGRTTLRWISKSRMRGFGLDSSGSEYGQIAGSSKNIDELSGFQGTLGTEKLLASHKDPLKRKTRKKQPVTKIVHDVEVSISLCQKKKA